MANFCVNLEDEEARFEENVSFIEDGNQHLEFKESNDVEEEGIDGNVATKLLVIRHLMLQPPINNNGSSESMVPQEMVDELILKLIAICNRIIFFGSTKGMRKNVFYLTLYGSVVGAVSFLLHQFSTSVNSILVNFGLSEEMHNPFTRAGAGHLAAHLRTYR
ncbi:hypothetical protein CsSME_00037767 [Camellia sinensis var. sinensis]